MAVWSSFFSLDFSTTCATFYAFVATFTLDNLTPKNRGVLQRAVPRQSSNPGFLIKFTGFFSTNMRMALPPVPEGI